MHNLCDIQHLKRLLSSIRLKPSLGQHFLKEKTVLDIIRDAGDLKADDTVLEIGSGIGALSQELAPRVKKLLSIEIDRRFEEIWKQIMKPYPNASLRILDARHVKPTPEPYKVIANIPYYLTSPLLKHFLRESSHRPERIVFLIQKDVAFRVMDERKKSLLFWEVNVFAKPEVLAIVPPHCFFPPPKVDSAILRILLFQKPIVPERDLDGFFKMLSIGFRQPRKTLANNFLKAGHALKDLPPKIRAHELGFEDWRKLFVIFSRGFSSKPSIVS